MNWDLILKVQCHIKSNTIKAVNKRKRIKEQTMEEGKKKSPMKLRDLGHYKWVSKGKGANKLKILFMSLQSKVL